jgi:hypothetical protein
VEFPLTLKLMFYGFSDLLMIRLAISEWLRMKFVGRLLLAGLSAWALIDALLSASPSGPAPPVLVRSVLFVFSLFVSGAFIVCAWSLFQWVVSKFKRRTDSQHA